MPEERQPFRTFGEDDYEEVAIAKETRVLLKCIINQRGEMLCIFAMRLNIG